jgi:hypothetical protein
MKNIVYSLLGILIFVSFGIVEANQLSFEQRVGYQKATEQVYSDHAIWPEQKLQPKPDLTAIITLQHL